MPVLWNFVKNLVIFTSITLAFVAAGPALLLPLEQRSQGRTPASGLPWKRRPRGLLGPVVFLWRLYRARLRGRPGCDGVHRRRSLLNTYLTGKVWIMGEQLVNNCILDQFINSHEQSYEEFLSTFTYLLKEDERKTIQGRKKSLRKSFSASEISNGNKQDGLPERSKEKLVSFPPQTPNENKTVINESWKSGGSDGNGLSLSERAQVDHHLETDIDGEPRSAGSFVLPGEVEEIGTCCTPPLEKPVQRKLKTSSVQQPLDNKAEELLGDDVQPFLLDEEFDYDNVALTPKFSEAELMPMKELSEEKKRGQM